jgi:hypothetical protein
MLPAQSRVLRRLAILDHIRLKKRNDPDRSGPRSRKPDSMPRVGYRI